MLLEKAWKLFENKLFPVASDALSFNPYRDYDARFDLPEAPAQRRQNLRNYLAAYEQRPPVFLLAEAPGPWGCRFSGVPLVSEAQLADAQFPLSGQPTSQQETPHHEYSARIYWRVLQPYFPLFFTWNTVPFHPHRKDQPLTIRPPRVAEVRAWTSLLEELLAIVQPTHCLAIGRKAESAYGRLGVPCTYIRHPSQGGAKLFEAGVLAVMEQVV